MVINARQVEEGSSFDAAVCIIGGGIAGITIALELKKQGIDVILLESGGISADNGTRDLYRGESTGLPYIFSDGCRSRYLGGSSNCWGGWCAPMDAHDFEKRDWITDSGWPISLGDILPYYKKAHDVLKLGPFNYDPAFWEKAIHHPEVKRIKTGTGAIIDKVSQFSAPVRMGHLYKDDLSTKDTRVFLFANVTDIECTEDGNKISRVKVSSLKGNSFFVSAQQFVLATGGIENARLLLSSNTVHKNGLGNSHDLVGRYFMDHPRLLTGEVSFTNQWKRNRLYDIKYNYHSPIVAAEGTCIAAQLAINPLLQEKEGLLNARVSFSSLFPGEGSTGALALWRWKQALLRKNLKSFRAGKDLLHIISHPVDTASYGITRFYRPRSLVKSVNFQIITEQAPNANSRVTLSNETDKLGMRRVNVNWQTGVVEQHTVNKTLSIIGAHLKRSGIVEKVQLDQQFNGNEWPMEIEGAWHHMGTTRMSDSPKHGVVNKDCKVHDIENLYIAGSSVFTTGGANFPTITLTALALRLSAHIVKLISIKNVKLSLTQTFKPSNIPG